MNLTGYLGAAYDSRVGLSKISPIPAFVEALKADPDLLAEAKAKRESLNDAICVKCFVSRTHRDILTSVLEAAAQ